MRYVGGDRVMAQVLAAVPTAGLDAVLVAVECLVEILQQFVNISFGAIHRRQAACILAREGLCARAEERDE